MTIAHPDVPTTDADADHVLAALHRIRRWMRTGRRFSFIPPRSGSGSVCPSSIENNHRAGPREWIGVERWAGTCMTSRCAHWMGHCVLGACVSAAGRSIPTDGTDMGADCDIADHCRWRAENGPSACVLCPAIQRLPIDDLIRKQKDAQ